MTIEYCVNFVFVSSLVFEGRVDIHLGVLDNNLCLYFFISRGDKLTSSVGTTTSNISARVRGSNIFCYFPQISRIARTVCTIHVS